jgi:nucleotide-binding universal stress UspA family protein
MSSQTAARPRIAAPVFPSIVCGVNGSRPSLEAARHAAVLACDGSALTYVAVSWEQGTGASAVATLSHRHAREILHRVDDSARELGLRPSLLYAQADDRARALLDFAAGQDLLVLGISGRSRAGGIMVGSAASTAVHRSTVPVLVARRPPEGVEFPSRIVLASDGTPASASAAALVAMLAARHASSVAIVSANQDEAPHRRGLAQQATQIMEATGTEPLILGAAAPVHRAVADVARDFDAALVVTGSRGLSGVAAVRSVSERIAHAAPCSVLVVRS